MVWILFIGLAHYTASQNSGTNDFSNFNTLFGNNGNAGASDPNSLASGTSMPTMLGGNGQGFGGGQDLTQSGANGLNSGMGQMNPGMTQGMNSGMGQGMNPGMGQGMNPGMNGQSMNAMATMPGQGMQGQGAFMSNNQQMMGQGMGGNPNQMMNPAGMGLASQNNMMMAGQQPGMQQGMMQNGFSGGMQQQQMNFQDPTRMGSLSQGNSFNNLAFDPRTQQNLFNDQLNQQNTPSFGGQSQMMQGQSQFGQSPFMQQPFGPQRQMNGQMQMGGRFGSPFTSTPSGFGPFQDPMMNAFAPANPFMQRPPMMMPRGPFMMPGMRKFIF